MKSEVKLRLNMKRRKKENKLKRKNEDKNDTCYIIIMN